jgi:hypothetical protein
VSSSGALWAAPVVFLAMAVYRHVAKTREDRGTSRERALVTRGGVLVEGHSVIIRRSTIDRKYPGGIDAYRRLVSERAFCADQHLTRVGFADMDQTVSFIRRLHRAGLSVHSLETGTDIGVVDDDGGDLTMAGWLELGRDDAGRSIARMMGTAPRQIAAPVGYRRRERPRAR